MALNTGYLNSDRTSNQDNWETPYYAVEPIIKYLKPKSTIWTPFDSSRSAFYNLLKEKGFRVIRSHIDDGLDFFDYLPCEKINYIISNPPFSKKDLVIERLYKLHIPYAMLLPLQTLQGIERYKYFKDGIQMLSFDKRIGFHETAEKCKTWNSFATCYFCKDVLPDNLIIEELMKYDRALK
jgi:hypothetical protein